MPGLTAFFDSANDKSRDSDKLLHLYWNRAALKKQFAGMRKEQFKLQDRIKQQEGATARLQQKLDHLEHLLIDPQWAGNVVAFYQLRGLALHCEEKLAKFSEQLKQQREQRQHNSLLVAWNDERTRESKSVEGEILSVREQAASMHRQAEEERHRLIAMSGFLKLFRRRSIASVLEKLSEQVQQAKSKEQALMERLAEIRKRKPPENSGLDLTTKRSINFMILSFAQQLLLLFGDDELAAMAKDASEKSVGSVKYGNRQECEHILGRVRKRSQAIEKGGKFAEVLQKRAKLIADQALFRNEGDAVPVAGSVSTVFDIRADGSIRKSDGNLLGENYWGIAKVLSR